MRISAFRIYLALAAAALLCGCGMEEPAPSYDGMIKVAGRMTPFAEGDIDTKSTKNQYESTVKNMALFVFDSKGDKVDYQFVNNSQPLFLIDRTNDPYKSHSQEYLDKCKLYILANVHADDQTGMDEINTEEELLASDCTISNVIRQSGIEPYGGLPMWGVISQTESGGPIDLRSSSTALVGQVLNIPLTCMMAKLTFNIALDPVQKSDYIQRFELKSWKIENAPSDVRISQPLGTDESEHADGPFLSAVTFAQVDNGVNPVMQGGSVPMTFCCYVPEQRVKPTGDEPDYPAGIDDASKQNFKPDWLTDDDKPLKITLNGIYTDHRNIEKEVTYTIYPGADNYKDFFVERNHEYIHDITIKGITNSIYGDELSISLDQRVDVQQNDFMFTIERETLLDSHWEIRPIRIMLDPVAHPDADHIEVEIMEGDMSGSNPWIRFEAPSAEQISSNPSAYCDVTSGALAYGKRRYFTTDLVTNTLKSNKLISFNATDPSNTGTPNEHAIWVYIDENVIGAPSSGSNTRQATVQCRYYEKGQASPTVTEDYYFIQKSLHNITYNKHSYGIEYFEEYLYNFDAREHYGETTDGMAWGLNNTQLSYEDRAIYFEGGFLSAIVNYLINSINQDLRVYDFYLSKAESADGNIEHPYSGNRFTKRISKKIGIGPLATNANASSAIEYCVNKNKRNSSTGLADEILWYLPAIDEMEEICKGGYSSFEVFQDKYYWSSQPAYQVYNWSYTSTENNGSGQMYLDNKSRARATKVDDSFNTVNSGQVKSSAEYSYALNRPFLSTEVNVKGPTATGNTPQYEPGNQLRTTVNRIRCAYRILQSFTSTFGFESGTSEGVWTSSDFSRNNSYKKSGNYAGRFRIQGGWRASSTETATVTSQLIEFPQQLSFYERYSGDTPTSSTWTVSVSSDNSSWTQVSTFTTLSTSFIQVPVVDLSSYHDVYVRIQNSTTTPANKETYVYIDDISFSYKE